MIWFIVGVFVGANLGLLVFALVTVTHERLRERAHRYQAAKERIEGYAHGYRDGIARAVPAIRVDDVPESFERAYDR